MALQKRSGQPIAAFCREHGLCEQSFYYWRGRIRPVDTKTGFAQVSVATPAAVTVHLDGGVALEFAVGADVAWVGWLIRQLQGN